MTKMLPKLTVAFLTLLLASAVSPASGAKAPPATVAKLRVPYRDLNEKKPTSDKKVLSPWATIANSKKAPRKSAEKAVIQTSTAGIVDLPYFNDIDEKTKFSDFTVIDANNDDTSWAWSSKCARISWGDGDMDDWLIMPAMQLEAGKAYTFEFDARCNSASFTERFEVKMGTSAESAAMTTTLIKAKDIKSGDWLHQSVDVVPEADGVYYIGIHGISTEADGFYLYVNDISMSAPMSTACPAPVTDVEVIPGADGALSATVSFTAPSTLINGQPVASLTKIEILEGTKVLATLDTPEAGKKYSTPVTLDAEGEHTFTVIAYNNDGAGGSVEKTAYIGINYPAAPQNVNLNETDNNGEVIVSWDPVAHDAAGFPLSSSLITYSVYSLNGNEPELLKDGLTGTSYTLQAVPADSQDIVQYAVFASTSRGNGDGVPTPAIFAGKPYDEFAESFADGKLTHPLAIMSWSEQQADWLIQNDESLANATSQDSDNGFMVMNGRMLDIRSALGLGKISLVDKTSPAIEFYTLGLDDGEGSPDINLVDVWVKEKGSATFVNVFSKTVDELAAPDEWGRVAVDLSDYAGKEVEIAVGGTIKFYVNVFFDNIRITRLAAHDLAVELTGPARAVNQTDFNLVAKVANLGKNVSGDYTVQLKADGAVVGTASDGALDANGTKKFEFTHKFQAIQHEAVNFSAEVIYADDDNASNNESEILTVKPKESLLPGVTDLAGAASDNGQVVLSWTQPDLTTGAEARTEQFEDGAAGDKTYGDWTFVDVDNTPVSGFRGVTIPGIVSNESTASFFLFDGSLPQFNETFAAHSGKQYLASLARYDFKEVDDWAISPELTGNAQTVTFFAKSYDPRYLEKIEVYASTGSTDPKDFTLALEKVTVPSAWHEYSVELPEGTRRFAIRSCADDAMMLMVDDVTYETALAADALTLKGYNVYRNRELITPEPVNECGYSDKDADGLTSYIVTAVFDKGESKGSNTVELTVSGLDEIIQNVTVEAASGMINFKGVSGLDIKVCGLDGIVLFNGISKEENVSVVAAPGLYVCTVANKAFKVVVK